MTKSNTKADSGMDGLPSLEKKAVPPALYDREYFLTNCGGFQEFSMSGGMTLPERLVVALKAADIRPGMKIADIGCGRGELVIHSALIGAEALGIDYSEAALELARESANALPEPARGRTDFQRSDVKDAVLGAGTFDVVLMTDIVEHLYPGELETALSKVLLALKPGGRLVVHTAPNIWYCRYGWVVVRTIVRLKELLLRTGNLVPEIHPSMTGINEKVHVNLQSPPGLRQELKRSGFTGVSVFFSERGPLEGKSVWNRVINGLFAMPFLRNFFNLSIFAVALKPSPGLDRPHPGGEA